MDEDEFDPDDARDMELFWSTDWDGPDILRGGC